MAAEALRLEDGDAAIEVDLSAGGRLSSLVVAGHQLLVTEPRDNPMGWGCYPMVPWAGRVRHGRFPHQGTVHQLPVTMAPHAIHGTAYLREWTLVAGEPAPTIETALGSSAAEGWTLGGRAVQRFQLTRTGLRIVLEVHAGHDPMPAMAGWHPWFRRVLESGPAAAPGPPVEVHFDAAVVYELDTEAIPTGALIPPRPGPWDNCFTALASDPVLVWPGVVSMRLSSSCEHWVIYTEPDHAVCVEPQTGPPDQFNHHPMIVEPGAPLVATFSLEWSVT